MVKLHNLLQVKDFFKNEYKYGENRNLFFYEKFHTPLENYSSSEQNNHKSTLRKRSDDEYNWRKYGQNY